MGDNPVAPDQARPKRDTIEVRTDKWWRLKSEVNLGRGERRRLAAQLRIERVINEALRAELEKAKL